MKLRTIAIILITLTLAFGSTAFAKSKHHKAVAVSQKSHHAAKLHHKGKHTAAAVTASAETPQAVK
jgi:hypothetical protein